MRTLGIIGGETHIKEVTRLAGKSLRIVGAAVRSDQVEWARQTFGCDVVTDYRELLSRGDLEMVSVANENDRKAEVIVAALKSGCDVIVDKPLAITMDEQEEIESLLAKQRARRLIMLLTLRGQPVWAALRDVVRKGRIGTPAFTHVRMAVRLKRAERPAWFLDVRRSGGLFLDLLIHAVDYIEWLMGRRIVAMTANTGNLGNQDDGRVRDHAAVYCELDDGSAAVAEGQRMLPETKGSDYRVTVAGTQGYADLDMMADRLTVTTPAGADEVISERPEPVSVVADWLEGGDRVGQAASMRANRLAILATASAAEHQRVEAR